MFARWRACGSGSVGGGIARVGRMWVRGCAGAVQAEAEEVAERVRAMDPDWTGSPMSQVRARTNSADEAAPPSATSRRTSLHGGGGVQAVAPGPLRLCSARMRARPLVRGGPIREWCTLLQHVIFFLGFNLKRGTSLNILFIIVPPCICVQHL